MAAGNFTFYASAHLGFFQALHDWADDDHYMILLTDSYTPSAAHSTLADVVAQEVAGGGDYAPQNITGETGTENAGVVTLDCADVAFGDPVSITAKYAVVLKGTVAGKDNADLLIGYVDLNSGGGSVSSTTSEFSVNINASGVATSTLT